MTIKMFENKKTIMKLTLLYISIGMVLIFSSCLKDPNSLSAIDSTSFHEKQIQLQFKPTQSGAHDSLLTTFTQQQSLVLKELDEMLRITEHITQSHSDTLWRVLTRKWTEFDSTYVGLGLTPFAKNESTADSLKGELFPEAALKWAQLNVELVKLSGEVRFGDALEILLYRTKNFVFPEDLLKSVIYTHVFDQIFVNVIGASTMDYQHTTGGNVRLIQETSYPQSNEMTLKCECNDLRYMDIFIRIPSWAVNPSVSHGNVKYVARPGEYSQISKKWQTGDEIKVVFRN